MKIGELSQKTGCKVVTIRFYEKEGLLPEPERTGSNYRAYDKNALERLQFIMHCRLQGMKLDCIKKLLAFRDDPNLDAAWMRQRIEGFIDDIEKRVDDLHLLKKYMESLLDECSKQEKKV